MAKCNSIKVKKAYELDNKRAKDLASETQRTAEGEVLAQTVEVTDKALDILKGSNPDLTSVDRQRLIANPETIILRQELSDVFNAAVDVGADSSTKRQEYVLKGASYKNGTLELTSSLKGNKKEVTYTFDKGANVSRYSYKTKNKMFIPALVNIVNRIESEIVEQKRGISNKQIAISNQKDLSELTKNINENIDDLGKLLGSTSKSKNPFQYSKASEKKNYVHGSVQDMKNVLSDLHATTTSPTSIKMLNYYEELLDNMHPRFFREMNLFINENADHTGGWVDIDKNHVLLNKSDNLDRGMTNEEAYVHEIIHTMTTWALENLTGEQGYLRHEFNYLRKKAYSSIKWQDIYKTDPNLTEEDAKERYNYIFNDETANDEFLAYGLTNPAFMALLEKVAVKDKKKGGVLEAIKNFFSTLMNVVMGNYTFKNRNSDVKKELHTLAFKLAEINSRTEKEHVNNNPMLKVSELIDNLEHGFEKAVHKLPEFLDTKGDVKKIPEDANKAQYIAAIAHYFTKGFYNPKYRDSVGQFFSTVGIKPDSSLREIVRSVLPRLDPKEVEPEFLGMQTNNIDMLRNTHVGLMANNIVSKFNKTLSQEEEDALTAILLETNATILFDNHRNNKKGYSDFQIRKLLSDRVYRLKAAKKIKTHIRKHYGNRAEWLIGQAEGLAHLMIVGEGHKAQNSNSKNIVRGFLTNERFPPDHTLLAYVEELVSLSALNLSKEKDLNTVSGLLKTDYDGVKNIVDLYEVFKKQSGETIFKNDRVHMMEGYIKELFDDSIDIITEPLEKEAELKKQGYTLISEVYHKELSAAPKLGVFATDDHIKGERLRGAVVLGNLHSRGLTLRTMRYKQFEDSKKHAQVWFEADKLRLAKDAEDINDFLHAGLSIGETNGGLVPIVNKSGIAVDYRVMMPKEQKQKYLNQRKGIVEVLSKTSGTLIDKMAREEQNERVLEYIKEDIKTVHDNPKSERNLKQYTLLSGESSDPENRKLFFMLPESYQEFANARDDKSLPVPAHLINTYFGYEHYRLSNIPGIEKAPTVLKRILNIIEEVWVDLVKIAKGNILLKMPAILVSNIVSNFFYSLNTGVKISEIFGMYRDSIRDVNAYMKNHKSLEQKKIELGVLNAQYKNASFSQNALDEHNDKVERLKNEMIRIVKEMEQNEAKELFEMGMYQAVIEDIQMYKLGDTNMISDNMDKLLNKMPAFVKTTAQVAYLSKETAWYKINQDILQLSDLVARDVMNRKQKFIEQEQVNGDRKLPVWYLDKVRKDHPDKKKLEGDAREKFLEMAKNYRHTYILDSFVNYVLPNGKGEEFLNRLGILMFTKYFKRIQRVVGAAFIQHPIRSALTVLGASMFLDPDMVQEQAFFYKAFDDNDNGIGGVLPVYNPIDDVLLRVVEPPLVGLANSAEKSIAF